MRHLKAFCAVAQEMHVTRAAKRLKMKQPALTQQLRLLERSTGVQLLQRTGRGITLTEAGRFFYKEAETILSHLQNALLKTQEIARGESGHIRIGVTEGASFDPKLACVFKEFRAKWPDVGITCSQKQTPELALDLREGNLDVAFMCPVGAPNDLRIESLYHVEMLLALPRTHRLSTAKSISMRDLVDQPFILISHGSTEHSLQMSLTAAATKAGFTPRILQTSPEFMLALNLVASGIALTFVPPYMTSIHPEAICYRQVEPATGITIETVIARPVEVSAAAATNLHAVAVAVFSGKKTDLKPIVRKLPSSRVQV